MPAYRRVPTNEEKTTAAAEKQQRQQRQKTVETISTKIHALIWCILAGVTLVSTDFLVVIFESDKVNRLYFNLALICIAINTVIGFYLCIYVPYIARIDLPWEVYCPRMIPALTIIGTLCGVLLLKALWPVWGFLTPLILTSLGMGAMFSLHFMPFCP